MAHVVLSLSGEGRGHATRVRAVVEDLRGQHRITVLAPGDAYQFLAPLYAGSEVRVRALPGLRFHYDSAGRLDYGRTARGAAGYLRGFRGLIREVERELGREPVDLAVVDFEPALPRAARRRGIPLVSLSHQQFLRTYDLSSLPLGLRLHAAYMGWIVRGFGSGQDHSIVSSFYFPPLRRGCRNVTQVGVLLRPEVRHAVPRPGDYLVAYLRRFAGPNVLDALADAGLPVRVYGLGEGRARGGLTFHRIDERGFVSDLAGCAGLVATAGNQLVGEALYLGKPCFVMPEAGNFEQYINAHFLAQTGAGGWVGLDRVTSAAVRGFVRRLDEHVSRIPQRRQRLDGLPAVRHVIEQFLPTTMSGPAVRAMPTRVAAHLMPEPSA